MIFVVGTAKERIVGRLCNAGALADKHADEDALDFPDRSSQGNFFTRFGAPRTGFAFVFTRNESHNPLQSEADLIGSRFAFCFDFCFATWECFSRLFHFPLFTHLGASNMKKQPLYDVSAFNNLADKFNVPWGDRIPLIETICWGSKGSDSSPLSTA